MAGHVCLFHIGRSGSSVLAGLLRDDPRFDWRGEVYEHGVLWPFENHYRARGELPAGRDAAAEAALLARRGDELPADWAAILTAMCRQAPITDGRVAGFEVKFFHLAISGTSLAGFLATIRSLGFDRVVVLKRHNYLRKIVSSLVLHQHRVVARTGAEAVSLKTVRLDVYNVAIDRRPRPLLEHLREFDRGFCSLFAELADESHLRLSFEEHVERDPRVAYEQVCEFLGFVPLALQPRLRRVNPFALEQILENHEEVAAHLEGTPYRWMLDS